MAARFRRSGKMDLSHVKLMWTNYPNMPTGGVAKRETYEKLVAFALKHNIVVVNDNPYSLILNEHPMSIMQVPGAKDCCIEFNSLSKSHNMPGWRVAMISSNKTFISWILKVKSNIDNELRGIQLQLPRRCLTTRMNGTARTTSRTTVAAATLLRRS